MVWIQVWTDPHEFIRADTIESIYYRSLRKGQKEDWIEVITRPHEKVILQISVNTGNLPANGGDQKAWQLLVNARAYDVIGDVVRVINDPALQSKVVHLKDLVVIDFGREAPQTLDIEIWVWDLPCHNCHQDTPVVYPVGAFFGYMLEFNFLSNLPRLLAEHYPFFKKAPVKEKEAEDYRNTCIHCGEPQPDWRVMESYLELVNNPEVVQEKYKLTVPLTEAEQEEYKKADIASTW
jgi:hypothetical protein